MATEADCRWVNLEACLEMNAKGPNQGASGNISLRYGDQMLISPSAIPYPKITPDVIGGLALTDAVPRTWTGPAKPCTEWRFHWHLIKSRSDVTAVVHAHPT